jgi:hypothetical protein
VAPDYNYIAAAGNSSFTDYVGDGPGFEDDFSRRADTLLQLIQLLLRNVPKHLRQPLIVVAHLTELDVWQSVDQSQAGMELRRELRRPAERSLPRGIGINGTQHVAEEDRLERGHLLDVYRRQDWTVGIMKNFGRYRTENKAPKPSVPVCRHHDQIHLFRVRQVDYGAGDIPFQQHVPDGHVPEVIGLKLFEFLLRLLTPLFPPLYRHTAGHSGEHFVQLEGVSQDDLRTEATTQRLSVMGRCLGSLGEINGQEYLLQLHCVSSFLRRSPPGMAIRE